MSISSFGAQAAMGGPTVISRTVGNFESGDGPVFSYPYDIMGVTRDAAGAVLPNCIVQIFRTADDSYVSQVTSDANGYYAIPASNLFQHYLVAYLPGAPDVAGTTVNTLTGS